MNTLAKVWSLQIFLGRGVCDAAHSVLAFSLAVLVALAPHMAQAQTPPTAMQTAQPQPPPDYQIGPGDVLAITVYRAPDLQTTARVSGKGTIVMAPLGEVTVGGLTPSQTGERIAHALKTLGVFLRPSVNVLVTEYRSKTVAVLGAVSKPGEIALDRQGLTIADVLARAGATFGSGAMIVTVIGAQDGKPTREEFRVADLISGGRDRPVRAGEQLFLQEAPTFYIAGQVTRAGAYPVSPGMTVGQAIAVGGGLTQRGSLSRVKVTRKDASGTPVTVKPVKLDTIVVAGDLIDVGARWF